MERRSHDRLAVQLRCKIYLAGQPPRIEEATTENISRGGILLRWATAAKGDIPKIGDVIHADIPMRRTIRFEQRYLRCEGEVMRVSWEGSTQGVLIALRFRNMRLQPQTLKRVAAVAV